MVKTDPTLIIKEIEKLKEKELEKLIPSDIILKELCSVITH